MLKSLNVSVIAGLALALASTGALAQKKPAAKPAAKPAPAASSSSGGVGQGDMEIGFFGNLRDDGATTLFLVGGSVGRYLTDSLEARVTASLAFVDAGGISSTILSPFVTAEYQFNTGGPVVPYVGGGLGFFMLGNDDIFQFSLFVTPTGGVKYFLNERTSLEYALSYQYPLYGETCTDVDCFDADITTLQNTFRINLYY
jgi:hypothetical protein